MSTGDIEYRIRSVYETKSIRLCDWPISDPEGLIREIVLCGGVYDGDNYRTDFTHQIVYQDGEVFVEILFDEDTDDV